MRTLQTIIVDLDGTLALNKHRCHYIYPKNGGKPDWDSYFLACVDDLPNIPIIESVIALKAAGYNLHIFSARGMIALKETIDWLDKYNVPYDDLTLREEGCYIADEKLKRSWLLEYYPDFESQILCVFDDRDKVVDMWRSMGLVCLQVAKGNF